MKEQNYQLRITVNDYEKERIEQLATLRYLTVSTNMARRLLEKGGKE